MLKIEEGIVRVQRPNHVEHGFVSKPDGEARLDFSELMTKVRTVEANLGIRKRVAQNLLVAAHERLRRVSSRG